MKFKFCGDTDCPDWVLAEINNLSKLSSVKLKLLAQVVAKGIIEPPIDMEKAEKLFADSKLDSSINLKASIACVTYIITSTIRFNSDHNAMHSELQQLGLPREHSTSIKKVVDDYATDLTATLKSSSLRVNPLESCSANVDAESGCINLELKINEETKKIMMTPFTLNVLLDNLKSVRNTMADINKAPHILY